MNTDTFRPSKPLRLLDLVLRALRIFLILLTVLAVPLMVLALTGRATINVNGSLNAPFTVDIGNGASVEVSGNNLAYRNVEIDEDGQTLKGTPIVEASLPIEDDDLDSRFVVIVMSSVWLAAGWMGLVAFRGIIGSALRGEWLPGENPNRLRRLGGAILAYGAAGLVGQLLLTSTIDSALPFEVTVALSTWLTALIAGIAVLALAEPFAEAARLREFDASAI
jgi:hypothetical protein